jgi:hypothetical protein
VYLSTGASGRTLPAAPSPDFAAEVRPPLGKRRNLDHSRFLRFPNGPRSCPINFLVAGGRRGLDTRRRCAQIRPRMEKRSVAFLAVLFLLAARVPIPVFAEDPAIVLSPAEWDFGAIPAGSRAFLTLQVSNRGARDVAVSLLPTCDCLSTGPSRRVIAAGSRAEFRLSILAEDEESGQVRESYLIQTDAPGMDHFFYAVHGVVKGRPQRAPR